MEKFLDWLWAVVVEYGPKLLVALIVFLAGLWLAKLVTKLVMKMLQRGKVDVTLHSFIRSTVYIALMILVVVTVCGTLGVNMTSIITVIGAAGAAIALALQDSLKNIASGILILVSHPFRVGDYVQTEGIGGTVTEIRLFYTTLTTIDNSRVVLPNSRLTGNNLINYNAEETRRLDQNFSIGYQDDVALAKETILMLACKNELTIPEPEPTVQMVEHGNSAIVLQLRCWTKTGDYWQLKFQLLEQVKAEFDRIGISIPFHQVDVHVTGEKAE